MEHELKHEADHKTTFSLSKKKIRIIVALIVVLVILAPFAATILDVYVIGSRNPQLMRIARALPLPVLKVNDRTFTYQEYETELANLERILKGSGNTPSRNELQKMFVDRLKRAAAVKQLTNEGDIDIAEATAMARSLTFGDKMSNEEIEKAVREQFNWPMDYFESQVLLPFAREMALALNVLKPKADQIAEAVKAPRADFAKIAKEKGEDGTKEKGGDLGWFSTGMMVPEFERQVFAMKKGEVAGPFASRFGWHVVKVTDIRGEGDKKEVKASHIIVTIQAHEADIEPLIAKAMENVKVSVYVKE